MADNVYTDDDLPTDTDTPDDDNDAKSAVFGGLAITATAAIAGAVGYFASKRRNRCPEVEVEVDESPEDETADSTDTTLTVVEDEPNE